MKHSSGFDSDTYFMRWMPLVVTFNMASDMMNIDSAVDGMIYSAYYDFGNFMDYD